MRRCRFRVFAVGGKKKKLFVVLRVNTVRSHWICPEGSDMILVTPVKGETRKVKPETPIVIGNG